VAFKTVTASFTGVESSIDVTWSGVSASHEISVGVAPSDGFGAIKPYLTNHYATGATVNVSGVWSGAVKLTITDAPSVIPWPDSFLVSDLISAADNVHGVVGPLGTPLDNVIAMQVPSTVTSVQVQYANRALMYPGALSPQPSVTIAGCKVAVGPIATNGQSWTSAATVQTGITLPTGGALFNCNAVDVTGMRNANGEIGVAWSIPTGQTIYGEQPGYFGYGATNEDVSGLTSLTGPVTINPLFVNVTYRVPSTTRRIIIVGDSLTRGLSSGFGDTNPTYKQVLGWLIGARAGNVCCRAAGSGQTLQAWADQAGRPWLWDFEQWTGATALIILGTNDINGGARTSAQMLADLSTICDLLRAAGVFSIWAGTVAPSSTYSGAQNTNRTTYNSAVLLKPYGISYVLDVDVVLRNAGLPNQLAAANACSDAIHWTAAANTALLNQLVTDGKV
jgi:hypothetical protein